MKRQVNCTLVFADGGQVPKGTPIHTELLIDSDPGGPSYAGRVEENGRLIFRFPDCAPQGQKATLRVQTKGTDWVGSLVTPSDLPQRVDVPQPDGTTITWKIGPSTESPTAIVLQRSAQPGPFKRSGRVRAQGRCWVDDNGFFFPLGETLFWAPRGWKVENDRIRQNLKWLSDHRWDAIRILCSVAWQGNEIDPNWPDYQVVLAGLIDAAYDEYGLRVIPTVWGGGPWNPVAVTDKVVEVIKGREHKILYAEAVNESFNNLGDDAVVRDMSKRLMATGVLTASSCLNPPTDERFAQLASGCSNAITVHLDRSGGDLDWRFVRQPWDLKAFPWPTSQNEPKGPGSSVSSTFSALQIAQSRAVGIICGAGAYVLHNGAGIFGQRHVHPGTGVLRTANLFEMDKIDAIMQAVRGIDAVIPTGVENWRKANDGWRPPLPEHALPATDFWEDTDMQGVNKNYCAVDGPNRKFVCAPSGVRAPVDGQVGGTFKARWACKVKAYDTLTQELKAEATLTPDQTFTLPGRTDSMCAYIVVGELI